MSTEETRRRLARKLREELGELICRALDDPKVIEILLNCDGALFIERLGEPMTKVCHGFDPKQAEAIIGTIASSLSTVCTRESPILSGEMPILGARFQGMLPPIVSRPTFSIRKKASSVFPLEAYVEQGIMTAGQAAILREAVHNRENILVVGGTGTGKTTLANALIREMERLTPDHRLVIIEDTAEIQCSSENRVFLRTSDTVSMNMLLKATMRLRPDRIIVGEVRDGAALTLLKSWNTGHPGGLATVHANDARTALTRMEQLIAEVSERPMPHLLAEAINVVVSIQRTETSRRIGELVAVKGVRAGEYVFTDLNTQELRDVA
ncbi:MAG: P-type conjugative transfer ATPase TrbB [Microvirga sp.]